MRRPPGHFTSTTSFGIRPLKREAASEPIASTTGVPRSIPTSAVSSAEKMAAWVCGISPSATFLSFTWSVPVPPLPGPAAGVCEFEADRGFAGGELLLPDDGAAPKSEEIAVVSGHAVLQVERPAAEASALGDEGAVAAALGRLRLVARRELRLADIERRDGIRLRELEGKDRAIRLGGARRRRGPADDEENDERSAKVAVGFHGLAMDDRIRGHGDERPRQAADSVGIRVFPQANSRTPSLSRSGKPRSKIRRGRKATNAPTLPKCAELPALSSVIRTTGIRFPQSLGQVAGVRAVPFHPTDSKHASR